MLNSAEITQYLSAYQQGDQTAIEHVFPVVYAELKRIAHGQLQKAWSVNTICTTSLVHEAYLKLINAQDQDIKNRSHFFALAATAMRQIIINYAEQKQSQKRGGDWLQVTMEDLVDTPDQNISLLLNVNEAVNDIVKFDDSIAALIEQRFLRA